VSEAEALEAHWQALEGRWNSILGLEAMIDGLRLSVESLRAEMEAAASRTLTTEEKVHALNSDILQWTKAKTRMHHVFPRAKDFIHRSTWAAGAPERKKIEELVKSHVQPRIPFPEMDKLAEELESLLKRRQVLSAQGVTVTQECRNALAEVQGAFQALQASAARNAIKKRAATITRDRLR
jgi:hypothetical protein